MDLDHPLRPARAIILGFVISMAFWSCSAWVYHYYGLQGVDYNTGTLLGPKPTDDIPFSKCAPTGNEPYPCVVLFARDFMAMKQDYLDLKAQLAQCQKR